MGKIVLNKVVRPVFGENKVVTTKERYSTIPSDLLVARVAQSANVKENTCRAAMLGIAEAIRYFVCNGHCVNMGRMGFFRPALSCASVAKASQVSTDLVRKVSVAYTPSKQIKESLAAISFNA